MKHITNAVVILLGATWLATVFQVAIMFYSGHMDVQAVKFRQPTEAEINEVIQRSLPIHTRKNP